MYTVFNGQQLVAALREAGLAPKIIRVVGHIDLRMSANNTVFKEYTQQGLTFLIIEHNLKVVRAFSDRVVVLDSGRQIAEGTAEQILTSPVVIEAYLGQGHMGKGGEVSLEPLQQETGA